MRPRRPPKSLVAIAVLALFLAITGTAVAATRYATTITSGNHESTTAAWITAIATGIGALSAALALVGAAVTIFENRRAVHEQFAHASHTARQRLTYESVARFEDLGLIENQAVMSSFLRGGFQPPSISDAIWETMDRDARLAAAPNTWQHLRDSSSVEDRKTVLQILAFPNMLEGLAGMYNHGLLDYGIVKTRIEAEANNFWDRAKWWIDELRLQYEDNKIFRDMEVMISDLATRERPSPYLD